MIFSSLISCARETTTIYLLNLKQIFTSILEMNDNGMKWEVKLNQSKVFYTTFKKKIETINNHSNLHDRVPIVWSIASDSRL